MVSVRGFLGGFIENAYFGPCTLLGQFLNEIIDYTSLFNKITFNFEEAIGDQARGVSVGEYKQRNV